MAMIILPPKSVNRYTLQLKIDNTKIVSPVELKRNDLLFDFISCQTENDYKLVFQNKAKEIAQSHIEQRMLVFTKNNELSRELVQSIDPSFKYNVDVFSSDDGNSYKGFISGRKSILVADSNMGIGVNLPELQNVLHYGLPVSKAQYVQEIGRSGRQGQGAISTVVYKSKSVMTEIEQRIINFNSSIDEIISILNIIPPGNDIGNAFKRILGHVEHYSTAANNINDMYEKLNYVENSIRLSFVVNDYLYDIYKHQVYLYFLFRMGIVYNWFVLRREEKSVIYDIEVAENKDNISFVKQSTIEYITRLGQDKKTIYLIENATNIKEVIYFLQQWYYSQFLNYHREQLLNMLDFLEINTSLGIKDDNIIKQLSDHFSVSVVALQREEEHYISALTIREMLEIVQSAADPVLSSRIESSLENQYNSKLDLFLCLYQLFVQGHLNIPRLERVIEKLSDNYWIDLMENIYLLFRKCNEAEKLNLLNVLCRREKEENIIANIYYKNKKDLLFMGYLAQLANIKL